MHSTTCRSFIFSCCCFVVNRGGEDRLRGNEIFIWDVSFWWGRYLEKAFLLVATVRNPVSDALVLLTRFWGKCTPRLCFCLPLILSYSVTHAAASVSLFVIHFFTSWCPEIWHSKIYLIPPGEVNSAKWHLFGHSGTFSGKDNKTGWTAFLNSDLVSLYISSDPSQKEWIFTRLLLS